MMYEEICNIYMKKYTLVKYIEFDNNQLGGKLLKRINISFPHIKEYKLDITYSNTNINFDEKYFQ